MSMLVLLDRDGVLNQDRVDHVKNPGELEMIPGSAAAVARLKAAGHRVVVVTNQSCVGRGLVTPDMLAEIHRHLYLRLADAGAVLDDLLVCCDPPWQPSRRRKPAPGMLHEALAKFRMLPSDAVMIGDAVTDIEAAAAIGCRRILVRTGKGVATLAAPGGDRFPPELLPVAVHEDLADAVSALLEPPP